VSGVRRGRPGGRETRASKGIHALVPGFNRILPLVIV
jgi:hypothetical protein